MTGISLNAARGLIDGHTILGPLSLRDFFKVHRHELCGIQSLAYNPSGQAIILMTIYVNAALVAIL